VQSWVFAIRMRHATAKADSKRPIGFRILHFRHCHMRLPALIRGHPRWHRHRMSAIPFTNVSGVCSGAFHVDGRRKA
jgi:hypothetical protein